MNNDLAERFAKYFIETIRKYNIEENEDILKGLGWKLVEHRVETPDVDNPDIEEDYEGPVNCWYKYHSSSFKQNRYTTYIMEVMLRYEESFMDSFPEGLCIELSEVRISEYHANIKPLLDDIGDLVETKQMPLSEINRIFEDYTSEEKVLDVTRQCNLLIGKVFDILGTVFTVELSKQGHRTMIKFEDHHYVFDGLFMNLNKDPHKLIYRVGCWRVDDFNTPKIAVRLIKTILRDCGLFEDLYLVYAKKVVEQLAKYNGIMETPYREQSYYPARILLDIDKNIETPFELPILSLHPYLQFLMFEQALTKEQKKKIDVALNKIDPRLFSEY